MVVCGEVDYLVVFKNRLFEIDGWLGRFVGPNYNKCYNYLYINLKEFI